MEYLLRNFRGTFFGALLLGVCVIGALISNRSHLASTAIVVMIMLCFGVLVWKKGRSRYASENDADSFYYLGFVYTLATLVASFLPFLLGDDGNLSEKQVVGFFGLGLITTFIGLTGRIFFSQFNPEPINSLDKSLEELANAVARLTSDVANASHEIVRTKDQAEADFGKLRKAAAERQADIESRFEATYEQLMSKSNATLARTIEVIESQVSVFAANVEKAKESDAKQSADIARRFEAFYERLLSKSTEALSKSTEQIGEGMGKFCQELSQQLNKLGPTLEKVSNTISVLSVTIDHNAEGVRASFAKWAAVSTEMAGIAQALLKTQNQLLLESEKAMSEYSSSAGRLVSQTNAAGQSLVTLGESLAQAATVSDSAISSGKKLSQSLQETGEVYSRLVAQIRADLQVIEGQRTKLEGNLQTSTDAILKVHKSLVGAAEVLLTRLEGGSAKSA